MKATLIKYTFLALTGLFTISAIFLSIMIVLGFHQQDWIGQALNQLVVATIMLNFFVAGLMFKDYEKITIKFWKKDD